MVMGNKKNAFTLFTYISAVPDPAVIAIVATLFWWDNRHCNRVAKQTS